MVGGEPRDQAVVDQAVQAARALYGVAPHSLQPGAVHRLVGVAQHAEQPPAALPVGAGPGLPAPGRPVVRRHPGPLPRAQVGHRAGAAPRRGRRADQGAELHHRHRPGGRGRLVVGQQPGGEVPLGAGDRGAGELHAGEAAREDPAHVGVEHDVALPEREGGDRGRGVVADAGQRPQLERRRAPRRRAGRRSRWPRRAGAGPGGGSRAAPTRGRPPRWRPRPGPAGVGQVSIQAAKTGSTRATGVCWSMNSLTMTAHGDARPARARAARGRGRRTRPAPAGGGPPGPREGRSWCRDRSQDDRHAAWPVCLPGSPPPTRYGVRMSTVTRPRGPLPRRVYWVRRLLVLGIALALVFGIGRLLGGGPAQDDDPSAQPAAATASSATPSMQPLRVRGAGHQGRQERPAGQGAHAARGAHRPVPRRRRPRRPRWTAPPTPGTT